LSELSAGREETFIQFLVLDAIFCLSSSSLSFSLSFPIRFCLVVVCFRSACLLRRSVSLCMIVRFCVFVLSEGFRTLFACPCTHLAVALRASMVDRSSLMGVDCFDCLRFIRWDECMAQCDVNQIHTGDPGWIRGRGAHLWTHVPATIFFFLETN